MSDFEERLAKHRRPDDLTAELSIGAPKCPRCGAVFWASVVRGSEPWCAECIRGNPGDYAPVWRAHFLATRAERLATAGVPVAFRPCEFDSFRPQTPDQVAALAALKSWAAGSLELGLFLHGPVGVGKTHLAVATLLELLIRRVACAYVSVRDLLLRCRESFAQGERASAIVGRYLDHDALVLDDLSERSTEFARETMELLIDRAYCDRRPRLIVTSNLNPEQLARRLEPRIADRLTELCQGIRLTGLSHRRRLARGRGRGG